MSVCVTACVRVVQLTVYVTLCDQAYKRSRATKSTRIGHRVPVVGFLLVSSSSPRGAGTIFFLGEGGGAKVLICLVIAKF